LLTPTAPSLVSPKQQSADKHTNGECGEYRDRRRGGNFPPQQLHPDRSRVLGGKNDKQQSGSKNNDHPH